jgi:hypothetical protein
MIEKKEWLSPDGKLIPYEEEILASTSHPGGGLIELIKTKWSKNTAISVKEITYYLDCDSLQPEDIDVRVIKFGKVPNDDGEIEQLVEKAKDWVFDYFGETLI